MKLNFNEDFEYKRIYEPLSAYTTTYNCIENNFPFLHSIRSALGFCDEVVVVDGCSTDGTYEELEKLQEKYPEQLMLYQNPFDWSEPGIDGLQKAFARAVCDPDHNYLIQFDVDEFFHEKDYEKWKLLTKRFPSEVDIVHMPVVELWGDLNHVTGRRHSWKWRVSRNKDNITHGINKNARLVDEETGRFYAKKGMSDGCEYVDAVSFEMLPHTGFYLQNRQIELARVSDPETYGKIMNEVFEKIPSVYHTSWLDIPRKLNQLQPGGIWDKLWSLLYQDKAQNRFPDIDFSDSKQVEKLVQSLIENGAEAQDQVKYKFKLEVPVPKLLQEWYNDNK